nr:hypothetical protein [Sphingomonas sp. Y57]
MQDVGLVPGMQDIHYDAVDGLGRQHLKRFLRRSREDDIASFEAQPIGQRMEIGLVVLDDQDLLGAEQARVGRKRILMLTIAQERPEPRQQYVEILVLAEKGIGAGPEGNRLRIGLRCGGQQDARGVAQGRIHSEPPNDGGTIKVRHHPVHDDGAWPDARGEMQPFVSSLRRHDIVTGIFQDLLDLVTEGGAVVDDEDGLADQRRVGLHPAEKLAASCDKIGAVIGFADIFVGADLHAANTVLDLRFGGQEHDRRVAVDFRRAHFPNEIDAVSVGQLHVEDQ